MCSISVEVAEGAMSLAQDRYRAKDKNGRRGGRVGEGERWEKSSGVLAGADARVRPSTKEVAACNDSRSLEEGMAGDEACECWRGRVMYAPCNKGNGSE